VLPEDSLAEGVVLDLPPTLPTCSLETEVEAADASEEGAEGRSHTYATG
jgi:hypothetical protein